MIQNRKITQYRKILKNEDTQKQNDHKNEDNPEGNDDFNKLNNLRDKGILNKLGQHQSQTPFSSAFWSLLHKRIITPQTPIKYSDNIRHVQSGKLWVQWKCPRPRHLQVSQPRAPTRRPTATFRSYLGREGVQSTDDHSRNNNWCDRAKLKSCGIAHAHELCGLVDTTHPGGRARNNRNFDQTLKVGPNFFLT